MQKSQNINNGACYFSLTLNATLALERTPPWGGSSVDVRGTESSTSPWTLHLQRSLSLSVFELICFAVYASS